VVEGLEQAGHIRQLLGDTFQAKGYNSKLRAVGCWVIGDQPDLTLESSEVKFAVQYTHHDAASFIAQQQAGIPCVRMMVTDKSGPRRCDPSDKRAAAQMRLLEELDVYAVALLKWRLQHAEGLPLGVLEGMRETADGAMQGTASHQQARSNLRVALQGFSVGSTVQHE
jgi:hypothetical protein